MRCTSLWCEPAAWSCRVSRPSWMITAGRALPGTSSLLRTTALMPLTAAQSAARRDRITSRWSATAQQVHAAELAAVAQRRDLGDVGRVAVDPNDVVARRQAEAAEPGGAEHDPDFLALAGFERLRAEVPHCGGTRDLLGDGRRAGHRIDRGALQGHRLPVAGDRRIEPCDDPLRVHHTDQIR